jgi:hypothetical protein
LKLSFDPNTNAMESTATSITENGMLAMRRALLGTIRSEIQYLFTKTRRR